VSREASVTILDRVDLKRKLTAVNADRRLGKAQGRLGRLVRSRVRAEAVLGRGVRGLGRLGQGRQHPAHHRRHGPPHLPRHLRGLPDRRGEGSALPLALLAPRPAGGVRHPLRPIVVRTGARRARRGLRPAGGMGRSYLEINDFEQQLVSRGIVLAKFWLHIDGREQLRRFQERETVAWKRHKIGPEDWRNREKWDRYEEAVSDMIARTSTAQAPWTLVAANDKRWARVQVVESLCAPAGEGARRLSPLRWRTPAPGGSATSSSTRSAGSPRARPGSSGPSSGKGWWSWSRVAAWGSSLSTWQGWWRPGPRGRDRPPGEDAGGPAPACRPRRPRGTD